MSQELAPRANAVPDIAYNKLKAFWARHHRQIAAVTIGNDANRLMRVTFSVLHRNPKLIECSQFSLLNGIVLGHQLGLVFGTPEVSLVPFGKEATLIVGYQGKTKLALQSGSVQSIEAEAVHVDDDWEYWRDESGLHMMHRPNWAARAEALDENTIVGAYCQMRIKGGGVQTKYVSIAEILKARASSRGYNYQRNKGGGDTPWITHFAEMALKTAIHRACKLVPQTPALSTAIALTDAEETGQSSKDIVAEGLDPSQFSGEETEESIVSPGRDAQAAIIEGKAPGAAPRAATLSGLRKLLESHRDIAMRILGTHGYEDTAQIPSEAKATEIARDIKNAIGGEA